MIQTGGDLLKLQLYTLWGELGQGRINLVKTEMGAIKAPISIHHIGIND